MATAELVSSAGATIVVELWIAHPCAWRRRPLPEDICVADQATQTVIGVFTSLCSGAEHLLANLSLNAKVDVPRDLWTPSRSANRDRAFLMPGGVAVVGFAPVNRDTRDEPIAVSRNLGGVASKANFLQVAGAIVPDVLAGAKRNPATGRNYAVETTNDRVDITSDEHLPRDHRRGTYWLTVPAHDRRVHARRICCNDDRVTRIDERFSRCGVTRFLSRSVAGVVCERDHITAAINPAASQAVA